MFPKKQYMAVMSVKIARAETFVRNHRTVEESKEPKFLQNSEMNL